MRPRSPLQRASLLGALLILGLVVLPATPSPAQGPATATVTVVHGLRGELVDVYLDDDLTLEGFQPERVTEPLQVPAGDHRVDLRPAGSAATDPPLAEAEVAVAAGANMSLVAHLDPEGQATVTAYRNDTRPLPAGQARLVARNTAEVAAISLVVDGDAVAPVAPEAEYTADLAPSTYRVAVNSPSGGAIVPAEDVPVPEGSATIMYLIGSQPDDTLIWIGESISGLQAPPRAVPTGNSGLAAPAEGSVGDGALLAILAGSVAVALLRRRRRAV